MFSTTRSQGPETYAQKPPSNHRLWAANGRLAQTSPSYPELSPFPNLSSCPKTLPPAHPPTLQINPNKHHQTPHQFVPLAPCDIHQTVAMHHQLPLLPLNQPSSRNGVRRPNLARCLDQCRQRWHCLVVDAGCVTSTAAGACGNRCCSRSWMWGGTSRVCCCG
jgi:hypothetical protein